MVEFTLIANPTSGRRAAPELAEDVVKLLKSAGHSAELRLTTAVGDARKWARELAAANARAVIGCGGDGTLQEIATALESTPTALGVLPRGRCNDFALALGIPAESSPEYFAHLIARTPPRKVDVGAIGEKRFLTVATLGFDSHVSRFVETKNLWVKGRLAYLYGIARVLPGFRFPRVRLSGDFGTIDDELFLVATGNGPCYGGGIHIAPNAKLDSGDFELCIVRKLPRIAVLSMLPKLLGGRHMEHPAVTMMRSKRVQIETPDGPQHICADGETIAQTPCVIEVRPGALNVIAPVNA
jgi:diacylglycerol kinase (ATP)